MAEDLHAAGVGGDHAADRRAVPRAEVDAEAEPGLPDVLLQRAQGHACRHRHLAGRGVHRLQVAHAGERQHHLLAVRHRPRHGSADQARVAALRDDCRAASRQAASTATTCSVVAGRTTAAASPSQRPVQSRS